MMQLALLNAPGPDPAEIGYPPTLPVEIALKTATIAEICEAYGLTRDDWDEIRFQPRFRQEVKQYLEMLKEEGMSFKLKARLQSEELLKTSWKMIHAEGNTVPPAVKADLIKSTMKWAGLDGSTDKAGGGGMNMQININLG